MPQFAPSSVHVATPVFSNPKSAGFDYQATLCMGAAKTEMAIASFHLNAGQSKSVPFSVTMPSVQGTYPVYLKVTSGGVLIGTFVATEGVVITAPAFTLKVILPANAMGWDAPRIIGTTYHVANSGDLPREWTNRYVVDAQGVDQTYFCNQYYLTDDYIKTHYPSWTITYITFKSYAINWGTFTLPGVGWNPSKLSTVIPMPQDDLTLFFEFFWAVAPSGPGYTYYETQIGYPALKVGHVHYGDVMTFDFTTKKLTVVPSREVVYPK